MPICRTQLMMVLLLASLALGLSGSVAAQPGFAVRPNESLRAEAIKNLREKQREEKDKAWVRARRYGLRTKWQDRGTSFELMRFEGDRPVYYHTFNEKAAISVGANLLYATPYGLTGVGVTVGVWDSGQIRTTHQEFGTRVTVVDSGTTNDHMTHVAGTIGASGVQSQAKGMAPQASLLSYNWTADASEMLNVGASYAGQANHIYISNHSYGPWAGWEWSGGSAYWNPNGGTAREDAVFGQYGQEAAMFDSVCFSTPYFLPVRAAGNDRDDPAPANGATYYRYEFVGGFPPYEWVQHTYDAATGPYADGYWLGGYDTVPDGPTAKNVLTVGAVEDAVASGQRSLGAASMTAFSAWGPTDDGRIKPDIVVNGASLYSPSWYNLVEPNHPLYVAESDSAYCNRSGTSMAAPSACGSAALLVQLYGQLFPGEAMLSSSLKALIIHTADDLGNAGPDYRYGWGLMNVKAAADHIIVHSQEPLANAIHEAELDSPDDVHSYTFIHDGNSDVRVTLCWTDPPGTAILLLDDHDPQLKRDLDVRVMDVNGVLGQPYILDMMHPDQPATTGDNYVDNVEQVDVNAALLHSVFTVRVSMKPNSFPGTQRYSLIVTGQQARSSHPALIKGRVVDSQTAQGVPGVTLSGEPGGFTAVTNSQGYYEMMVTEYGWRPSPLHGRITPSRYAYSFEPAWIDYNDVTMDIYEQNYTAYEIKPVISGMIVDGNSVGVSGVWIMSDPNAGSVYTDPNGKYQLTVPYGYTGTVSPMKYSTVFQPESTYYEYVTEPIGNQDYEAIGVFHRISGQVTGPGGKGLAGVSIVLDPNNGETLTDGQGYYYIDVIEHFNGELEPLKYGYILQPASRFYSDVTAPFEEQDYSVSAVLYDGFDDNIKGAAWIVKNSEPNALQIAEQGQRLNVMASEPNGTSVFYKGNGWRIDPNQPFTMKVDFHLGVQNTGEPNDVWLTFGFEDGTGNYTAISVGCAGTERYYAFAAAVDGNSFSAQAARTANDGTLYITGDPYADEVYISYIEYGAANAWQTLQCAINGCVGRDVTVFLGGGGYGVTLTEGQAWLDNVEINIGTLRGWPPVTDIDQDGYIGWPDIWYVANHWLENYLPADINKDGKVNFKDYALIVAGW